MGIKDYFLNKKKENKEKSILTDTKTNAIRLCYVYLVKYTSKGMIGKICRISSPFRLPRKMSIQDACKVVSYLSDKVERKHNLEVGSEKSVTMLINILNKYGFEKVENKEEEFCYSVSQYGTKQDIITDFPVGEKIEGVVDLFTVNGDCNLFKKTNLYKRYFDWYCKGVTKQEVTDIYKNLGKEYILTNNANSEDEKTL